jgi:hypothetical protein
MADQLTQEHEEYFRKIFREFDVNGDDSISKEVTYPHPGTHSGAYRHRRKYQ